MKPCPFCGKELTEYAVKCRYCGKFLKSEEELKKEEKFYTNVEDNEPDYAGFLSRVLAVSVDCLIMSAVLTIPFIVLVIVLTVLGAWPELMSILIVLMVWIYYAVMESSPRQATFGKSFAGIKVTDVYGQRISFGRASGRFWGKMLSTIPFYLGYVLIFFTPRRQCLHDMISGCVIVREKKDTSENKENL
jgi:uncharacterized RDD family membrane protein YckC